MVSTHGFFKGGAIGQYLTVVVLKSFLRSARSMFSASASHQPDLQ